jgi:hypothetical protein
MSEPTIVTVGADIVHDAQRITYTAYPSGVIFPLLFVSLRPDDWTPAKIAAQANHWADVWNGNAAVAGVESIAITQRVTAGGNLDDVALVIVSSTSGRSTSEITVQRNDFDAHTFAQLVGAERTRLDEIEAASPPPAAAAAEAGPPAG